MMPSVDLLLSLIINYAAPASINSAALSTHIIPTHMNQNTKKSQNHHVLLILLLRQHCVRLFYGLPSFALFRVMNKFIYLMNQLSHEFCQQSNEGNWRQQSVLKASPEKVQNSIKKDIQDDKLHQRFQCDPNCDPPFVPGRIRTLRERMVKLPRLNVSLPLELLFDQFLLSLPHLRQGFLAPAVALRLDHDVSVHGCKAFACEFHIQRLGR